MRAFLFVAALCASVAVVVSYVDHAHDVAATDDVRGLWSRYPHGTGPESAPVAFYYFHSDDIGLYRYGKVGYNTTHSYHWSADNDHIKLSYNKSGAQQSLQYRLEGTSPKMLVVVDDPHNPGVKETRYTWVPPPDFGAVAADLFDGDDGDDAGRDGESDDDEAAAAARVDNRLWIDLQNYQTGGMGFALYQLRAAGIDGRGTGWHHVGDFDDWSTEALAYRLVKTPDGAQAIDLQFILRSDRATSPLQLGHRDRGGKDVRFLTIQSDPRGFWAAHSFDDGGPSFGSFRTRLSPFAALPAGAP